MKLKADFVTNSSSASFVLYIASTCKGLDSFRDSFNRYLEEYLSRYDCSKVHRSTLRFYNPQSIEEIEDGIFKIIEGTSMYNTYEDIPHYMRTILLDSKIRKSSEMLDLFGFKTIWMEINR